MKTIRILGLLFLIVFQVIMMNAQSISSSEMNNGSGSGTSANLKVDYVVGNGLGIATLKTTINLSLINGREAVDEDVKGLPNELQWDILSAKAGIKAWPVPSQGDVQVLLEGVIEETSATVFDQTGKVVQMPHLQPDVPMKLEVLPQGIYFLRTPNPGIPTIRLVVN